MDNSNTGALGMLPHGNPWERISQQALESHADQVIARSSLITRVAKGDKDAIFAYFTGFWPFVDPFSSNIYEFNPPHRRLVQNLGAVRTREVLNGVMQEFLHMGQEEGEHAQLWIKDAVSFGIANLTEAHRNHAVAPSVQELIDRSASPDGQVRLALLAATEGMAEGLSRRLTAAPQFTAWLGGAYRWGDAHMMQHEGPSHYQIDLALLEACRSKGPADEATCRSIEADIIDNLDLFGRAADEVEAKFSPLVRAAE